MNTLGSAAKSVGAFAVQHPHATNAAVQGGVGAAAGAMGGGLKGALTGGLGGAAVGAASSYVDPKFNNAKEASHMAMNPQETVLYNAVYIPAYLEKVASRGHEIGDVDTLNASLEIAALLKQNLAKQANNTVKTAADNLRRSLGLPVVSHQKAASLASTEQRAKEASIALSQVPEVRKAFLELANSVA